MTTISINYGSDNNTAAPVYYKYRQQHQPQSAHLEFDPSVDGLALTADYSSEIGNALPARIWNRAELWFSLPSATLRSEIDGLENNENLAELLDRIKTGYEYDPYGPRGKYTEDAEQAIGEIDDMLQQLDRAEIWEAEDWIDQGMSYIDAAASTSIAAYAKAFDEANDPNQVIYGDIEKSVADWLCSHLPEDDDLTEAHRRVIAMLVEHDPSEYSHLAA